MKIYFLKEHALYTLKENIRQNLKFYSNETNEWIYSKCDVDEPFIEYKKEVKDFSFNTDFEKPFEGDIENIKRIYSSMSMLTESDATDERLWSGLEHGQFWSYMRYRGDFKNKNFNENDILNRFFFGQGKKRSLIINVLSKFWWIGKMTYDKSRKNPFEFTEFLKHDFATRALVLYSSNYSGNPTVLRALFSALIEIERQDTVISREIFNEVTKYLNILGGTYILDCFTQEELSEKIFLKAKSILKK